MRPPTPAQQAALERLDRTAGPRRRYTSSHSGASIVSQFRRYLEREDANQIGQALYEFLTMKVPSIIAHFGLVAPDGQFRVYYAEPALLLVDIYQQREMLDRRLARQDPDTVYADGQDELAVTRQLLELAEQHLERVLRAARERTRSRDLDRARDLASRHGFELVEQAAAAASDGVAADDPRTR